MGTVYNRGAGKGSGLRPTAVPLEVVHGNYELIFGKKNKEPEKVCEVNKTEPEVSRLEQLLYSVPSDLYDDNTWVKDICEEATKVLVHADTIDRLKRRIAELENTLEDIKYK